MNGMIIRLQIDCPTALVNGEQVTVDVSARLIDDKMMVPLRFLSERLGCQVVWDEVNCMAAVYTPEVKERYESIK